MRTQKPFFFIIIMTCCYFFPVGKSVAQDSLSSAQAADDINATAALKEGESHLMIVGLTTFGFVNQATTNTLGGVKSTDKSNSLGDADRFEFSPMFLWRHGDKMLLEFEPSFDGVNLGVNWADISYFVSPGLIIRGGYFVLPLGTYSKRLAAGWINKLPSDPIGIGMAGSDFGIEIEGGMPLGNMKWAYDLSLTNGMQLNNDGTTTGVGISAINNGKTVCGRLALLPFSNSSMEVGISGLYGTLASPPGANFTSPASPSGTGPTVSMIGADLNYVKDISPIYLNIKGQYLVSMVNNENYVDPNDTTSTYSFTNKTTAAFAQISIRPSKSKNKVLKNLELAFREVVYQTPQNSTWGQNYSEQDVALDYWLSWRTVLKVGYENINSDATNNVSVMQQPNGSTAIKRLIVQFSTEF